MSNLFPLIIVLLAAALIAMTIHAMRLSARHRNARQHAASAESAAASAWGDGYQAATTDINARRDGEAKASYDRGFENGWNACVTACGDRLECKEAATA